MHPRLQFLAILAGLIVVFVVLELIRKGRLREEYSLIWLFSAAVVLILAVFRGSLQILADLIEIDYAPSLLFLVGLGLLMIIQLLQAITISKLAAQNRELAQRIALLAWHLQNQVKSGQTKDEASVAETAEEQAAVVARSAPHPSPPQERSASGRVGAAAMANFKEGD